MAIERVSHALAAGRLTISRLDDGSGVVLDVVGEQLLTMNATGLAIVQAIEAGADSEQAVAEWVAARFEVPVGRVLVDVRRFVIKLDKTLPDAVGR